MLRTTDARRGEWKGVMKKKKGERGKGERGKEEGEGARRKQKIGKEKYTGQLDEDHDEGHDEKWQQVQ